MLITVHPRSSPHSCFIVVDITNPAIILRPTIVSGNFASSSSNLCFTKLATRSWYVNVAAL